MKYRYGKSKAGHDKDKIYLIINEDERFYYLSPFNKSDAFNKDCKVKAVENDDSTVIKKKNKKHIQPIK